MHALKEFETTQLKSDLPAFKAGDTLRIHCKIKEGNKERIQVFEGVVISRHNRGTGSSFTVRKISHGIGVERVFPLHAPFVEKIEVMTVGKVRQSRLYYLRKLSGKKARIAAVDTRARAQAKAAEKAAKKEKLDQAAQQSSDTNSQASSGAANETAETKSSQE